MLSQISSEAGNKCFAHTVSPSRLLKLRDTVLPVVLSHHCLRATSPGARLGRLLYSQGGLWGGCR